MYDTLGSVLSGTALAVHDAVKRFAGMFLRDIPVAFGIYLTVTRKLYDKKGKKAEKSKASSPKFRCTRDFACNEGQRPQRMRTPDGCAELHPYCAWR